MQAKPESGERVGDASANPRIPFHSNRATVLKGRTENNRVVNFPGHERLIGAFVDVRVTEAQRDEANRARRIRTRRRAARSERWVSFVNPTYGPPVR